MKTKLRQWTLQVLIWAYPLFEFTYFPASATQRFWSPIRVGVSRLCLVWSPASYVPSAEVFLHFVLSTYLGRPICRQLLGRLMWALFTALWAGILKTCRSRLSLVWVYVKWKYIYKKFAPVTTHNNVISLKFWGSLRNRYTLETIIFSD